MEKVAAGRFLVVADVEMQHRLDGCRRATLTDRPALRGGVHFSMARSGVARVLVVAVRGGFDLER